MIIWLASYPRSGNTLLRTVLKQCFGIKSYSDQIKPKQIWTKTQEQIGHVEYTGTWSDFYKYALASKEKFFIKTHLPPIDDSPCIYIVRNGRAAILSYFYYYQEFFSDTKRNIPGLILGCDYYQDWSTHFTTWIPDKRQHTLLVKYEEVLSNTEVEIKKIVEFINFSSSKVEKWKNPFQELSKVEPTFFRQGSSSWKPDIYWTQIIEQLFWKKHHYLMQNLNYEQLDLKADFSIGQSSIQEQLSLFQDQIIEATNSVLKEQKIFQEAADQRLHVIKQLDAENKHLKKLQS